MNEIDLIPADFRRQRQTRRLLKSFVLLLLALAAVVLAITLGFGWQAARLDRQLTDLQERNRIGTEQRKQLAELERQRQSLTQRLQLLHGLRSGVAADRLFLMMDRVLPEQGLWLTQWQFRRAGTRVDAPDTPLGQGYFLVIPRDGRSRDQKPQTWRIDSEMTLSGQAEDYAALSAFILRLTDQPEVARVRMIDNQRVDYAGGKLVNFRIGVTLAGSPAEKKS